MDRRLRFFLRRRSLSAKEKSESLAIGEGGVPVHQYLVIFVFKVFGA